MVVLADISSIAILRAVKQTGVLSPVSSRDAKRIADAIAQGVHVEDVDTELMRALGFSSNCPLHILVSDTRARRNSTHFVCHVWQGEAQGISFLKTPKGFVLAGPELTLAMYARQHSLVEVIELAMEFCGGYRLGITRLPDDPHPPILTTLRKLQEFVSRNRNERGVGKLEYALNFIGENSWSPMETKIYMLLTLPRTKGGFGFPKPLLNFRIDVPRQLREFQGRTHFYCDMYWPEYGFAIEYDGKYKNEKGEDEGHFSQEGAIRDKQKAASLSALGISVMALSSADMRTYRAMELTLRKIAMKLKRKQRKPNAKMLEARQKLYADLFPQNFY